MEDIIDANIDGPPPKYDVVDDDDDKEKEEKKPEPPKSGSAWKIYLSNKWISVIMN